MSLSGKSASQEEGGSRGDGKSFDKNNRLQCAQEDMSYPKGSCLASSWVHTEALGLQLPDRWVRNPCGEHYLLDC